jgi:hypothetical protein
MQSDPNATRQRAVSFDPQTGQPNEDFYRDKNDLGGLFDAEQNWKPHGAKRGWKNSIKSGLMMASQAIQSNPNDPVTAAAVGFGVGAAGTTAAPNFKNRLKRQWKLGQVGGELQNQLKLQGEQAKISALNQKPEVQNEREVNNALTQYNRLEHFDPDDPADAGFAQYFTQRGLKLPKKDKYHRPIASWANGQLLLTDSEGTHHATVEGEGNVSDAGRTPNEQGLNPNQAATVANVAENRSAANTRAANVQSGQDRRAARAQAGSNYRAGLRGTSAARKVSAGERKDIAETAATINAVRRDLSAVDDEIKNAPPTVVDTDPKSSTYKQTITNPRLTVLGRKRKELVSQGALHSDKLNRLDPDNEWGSGTGGYPYSKPRSGASDLDRPNYGTPRSASSTVDPLKGVKWSKSRYRGSKPIEQAAKEAAARGAIVVN